MQGALVDRWPPPIGSYRGRPLAQSNVPDRLCFRVEPKSDLNEFAKLSESPASPPYTDQETSQWDNTASAFNYWDLFVRVTFARTLWTPVLIKSKEDVITGEKFHFDSFVGPKLLWARDL